MPTKPPRKAAPKDHHQISRFYLEGFAEGTPRRHVWAYDKHSGAVRHATAKETGFEKHLYSVTNDDGSRITAVEDWIAGVEDKAAPILAKIVRNDRITDQERADFASFLALMYVRTNSFRRQWAEAHGQMLQTHMYALAKHDGAWKTFIRMYETERGPLAPELRERLRQYMIDTSKYIIAYPKERTLRALQLHDTILEHIFDMKWTFIHAPTNHFFITSDAPLTKVLPPEHARPFTGAGFANRHIEVTCPLTANLCWFGHWRKEVEPYVVADEALSANLNGIRAVYAERYLYASCEDEGVKALAQEFRHSQERMVVQGYGPDQQAEVKVTRR